ncbi:MAG: M50 family metallopeptidase [Pirellulaceae bacterium]|nr:M50 family metallopeptidase [Pirellulaceae bacterium]
MSTRGIWAARIDYAVEWLKWPVAVGMLTALPLFAWGLLRLIGHVLSQPLGVLPLAIGTGGFIMLWRRWLDTSTIGRWLITVEHELTHAIFAWATGHRVVAIKASLGRGGEVRFMGRGNWLITLAPYFFPTAAIALLLMAYLMSIPILPWPGLFLGVALGFHIVSTYRETHRDQSDLKSVGAKFCWMFLPTANLAVLGLLLAWAHGGTADVKIWLGHVQEPIDFLRSYFQQLPPGSDL